MKVSAITSSNFNQPNFKGLSRVVQRVEDNTYYEGAYETEMGTCKHFKTIYYYPFADETQEEIQKFVKSNTSSYSSPTLKPVEHLYENTVEVQKRLSLTKKDYENYLESMRIAKGIYDLKLQTARRNEIKSLASSAVDAIEEELQQYGLKDSLAKV